MDAVQKTKEKYTGLGKQNPFKQDEISRVDRAHRAAQKQHDTYNNVNKSTKKKKGKGKNSLKEDEKKTQGQIDNENGMRNYIENWEHKLVPLFRKADIKYVRRSNALSYHQYLCINLHLGSTMTPCMKSFS